MIDPATGMDIPTPSDDLSRRRTIPNLPADRQTADDSWVGSWTMLALAVAVLIGVGYYFFGGSVVTRSGQ